MKYQEEFRDSAIVKNLAAKIAAKQTKPWTIMEICGGQTHAILKNNLTEFLPGNLHFVHGPGCPVCVTPLEIIDKAVFLSLQKDVIFTSYGDMLRVPGSTKSLLYAKAEGADVRMVFSPLDALKIAEENPTKQVVFFAVGFETTAPANAMAVLEAKRRNLKNFSMLSAHVLVPPAMEAILSAENIQIQGFIAAGHVCTVMGYNEYFAIAQKYQVPIVVGGFEPVDLMEAVYKLICLLEEGKHTVENAYSRIVTREGNIPAQKVLQTVYEIIDRPWRGIGIIPKSGLKLNANFAQFDADLVFNLKGFEVEEPAACKSGDVLKGILKPTQCPAFGTLCTPENPLGAPMVSSEGACSAYYLYKIKS